MLTRTNIEFAKRVFLDRLTCDNGQPLVQPANIDAGPGDQYEYGGTFDPYNFGIGADCSGLCGIVIGAALHGTSMTWGRMFSTETFPGPFQGFRQTTQNDCVQGKYPIKVTICHGGGGPNSHMACQIDGGSADPWDMESNGDYGTCTYPPNITGLASDYWNDWWVYDQPIQEDGTAHQSRHYPLGVDYAGGRISGADLKAAGVSFVTRYLADGGTNLPYKMLTPAEAKDLQANGIAIVGNWESTAQAMLGGQAQGIADANAARAQMIACGGPPTATIYFSADWDQAPNQQAAVNAYLKGACSVLGGPGNVGIYGGYWPIMRALNAGVCAYAWQTEAWSGGNVDSRVRIIQRNQLGYKVIGGVQCDINEQHNDDIGQWHNFPITPPAPAPVPDPGGPPNYGLLAYEQLAGPRGIDGYGHGWPQLGGLTIVDFLAKYKPVWDAQLSELGAITPPTPTPTPTPTPAPTPGGTT